MNKILSLKGIFLSIKRRTKEKIKYNAAIANKQILKISAVPIVVASFFYGLSPKIPKNQVLYLYKPGFIFFSHQLCELLP